MSGDVLRPRRPLSSRSVPGPSPQYQPLCLSTEAPARKRFGAFREIKPRRRSLECKFLETAAFEFGFKGRDSSGPAARASLLNPKSGFGIPKAIPRDAA